MCMEDIANWTDTKNVGLYSHQGHAELAFPTASFAYILRVNNEDIAFQHLRTIALSNIMGGIRVIANTIIVASDCLIQWIIIYPIGGIRVIANTIIVASDCLIQWIIIYPIAQHLKAELLQLEFNWPEAIAR